MKTIRELCITVTMRLVAAGHTLREAQELAVLAVLGLLMLCDQRGDRSVLPEECRSLYRPVSERDRGPRGMRAFLPAAAARADVPVRFYK
jgi:hypothetical protein